MRTITDIYNEYRIPPALQLHQFRVTGVALQIIGSIDVAVDADSIIVACLLHDMGNIIKFNLDYFPEFLEPEGLEYWQNVQNEYIEKYGRDEHQATLAIARELGMSEEVVANIDAVGFPNWCIASEHEDWNRKICVYADIRVAPKSVVSLEERLEDGMKRYGGKYPELETKRFELYDCIRDIESQIFSHMTITPSDITDASIASRIEALKNFEI